MVASISESRTNRLRVSRLRPGYSLSDCGNAERLIDQHADSIRFCPALRQWFVWNGSTWTPDNGAAVQIAKKTVRAIEQERRNLLHEADRAPEGWEDLRRRADALGKWEIRSEGAAQIAATLRMAESDPRIVVDANQFNSSPWLLNVQNGTIDLSTGQLGEHRPEHLLTKMAEEAYRAEASCPRWERFLSEVFDLHPDVIPYLQRAVGYTLTGNTSEECVFVLVGCGRNGKSTLLLALQRLLGDYAGVAEMDTFLTSRGGHLREDLADMRGRRLVTAQEPMLNSAFAESTLKWVSGGDRLRARRLYEHAQEFEPTHKLWLAVNRLPNLRSDDPAAWSRLRVIPCDASFATGADLQLKQKLRAEGEGILKWAVRGCLMWQREGLGNADSVTHATERWRTALASAR